LGTESDFTVSFPSPAWERICSEAPASAKQEIGNIPIYNKVSKLGL